jgi:probable blue pigment (indigoidine) exporter
MRASNSRAVGIAAIAPTAWGTTYLVTTELLPPNRPFLAGALRALPAGLLLLSVTRTLPRGRWWAKAAVLGMLNIGAFFALLFTAAYRLPGGLAATLGAFSPLVVLLLSWPLMGIRPSVRALSAGAAGVGGVALMVLRPDAALDGVGVGAALAGALLFATGTTLTKRWGRPVPLLAFTAWQLVAGGLFLLPLALLVEGAPASLSAVNIAGYAYLTLVSTALAYSLWFGAFDRLPAATVSFISLLSPVVATGLGYVVGQRLSAGQLAGAAVVLAAVMIGQRTAQRDAARQSAVAAGQAAQPAASPA